MKKLLKYGWLLFAHMLYEIITSIVPKNKNLWIFGSWEGKLYADNAKYLYEWVVKQHPEVNAVWLTTEDSVYSKLKEKGYSVYLASTLKAKMLLARAAVVVETEGNADIGGYRPGRTKIIQLWHGVGPKNTLWEKHYSKFSILCQHIIFDHREKSYWMLSSETNKFTIQKLYHVPNDHCVITGYPRCDILVERKVESNVIDELETAYPCHKKLMYMPTHRNFGKSQGLNFSREDLVRVNDFLKENRYVLVFKPHMHEMNYYSEYEAELSNIVIAKDTKYSDVYSYISGMDLLICDYSSIIYDFLCIKKPIVLFNFDMDEYEKSVGLLDFYYNTPCGPFCRSWDDVLNNCKRLLENDTWEEKREKCRILMHPQEDGNNCKRVYEAIREIVG